MDGSSRPVAWDVGKRKCNESCMDQLKQYELILNQETLDIYNFIIERDEVPPELENQVMGMLRQFALDKGVVPTPMDYEKKMKSKMSN